MSRLAQLPGYRRLWAAATVSSFGTYVTALALQILAAVTLHATATQLGLLNAARWLPYLLIGLLAGVLVDRYRRKPVLVGTDLGRAALLCAVPLLYLAGRLSIPALIVVVAAFGTLSLFFDAADQSFLPRLVPARLLTPANARLEQSDAVAQTARPDPAACGPSCGRASPGCTGTASWRRWHWPGTSGSCSTACSAPSTSCTSCASRRPAGSGSPRCTSA